MSCAISKKRYSQSWSGSPALSLRQELCASLMICSKFFWRCSLRCRSRCTARSNALFSGDSVNSWASKP
ncbi:Uncharacterised protein [Vibrio cholerae]|nr:Uncharacterised protein [Vibrio cholerae]CSB13934.1 Uncharacterised protein [Vibrio cholerae]CSC14797.1 Uncharacterised protein [Vibrio cholerae]CSD12547.1 Uncharacterised protein [Vibrio cholerae]CSD13537.1 Uncharacterised protein [Vibrio cholerae]